MYSTTLKHSPTWRSEIPALASPGGLNLRESNLPNADLSIPLHAPYRNTPQPTSTHTPRTLHVPLLTSSDLTTTNTPAIVSRLRRLVQQTGGLDIAILLLLSFPSASVSVKAVFGARQPAVSTTPTPNPSPIHSYQSLQSLILTTPDLRGMPILPLSSPIRLIPTLKAHMSALTSSPPSSTVARMKMENPSPRDLLAYATATAPTQLLSEHAVNVLMDVVPDFETLARAGGVCGGGSDGSTGRANEGAGGGSHETDADGSGVSRKLKERINDELKGLVDEDELKGMWEFWGSEWVVE